MNLPAVPSHHKALGRSWECKLIPGLNEAVGNCVLQCSSTCAGGFQRRVVVCQDENGYTANNCDEKSKPMEQRSCESGPCPQWAYGNWGEVSAPSVWVPCPGHDFHWQVAEK